MGSCSLLALKAQTSNVTFICTNAVLSNGRAKFGELHFNFCVTTHVNLSKNSYVFDNLQYLYLHTLIWTTPSLIHMDICVTKDEHTVYYCIPKWHHHHSAFCYLHAQKHKYANKRHKSGQISQYVLTWRQRKHQQHTQECVNQLPVYGMSQRNYQPIDFWIRNLSLPIRIYILHSKGLTFVFRVLDWDWKCIL